MRDRPAHAEQSRRAAAIPCYVPQVAQPSAVAQVDGHLAVAGVSGQEGALLYEVYTRYSQLVKLALEASCTRQHKTRVEETFAKLKEELARERGFVCGILTLPDESVPSRPSRSYADFVVCLASQA